MLFHVELIKPVSPTWKLFLQFLNHDVNWMFQCQDKISSKPGFALAEEKWSNVVRITVCDFTEKRLHRRFTYLAMKL